MAKESNKTVTRIDAGVTISEELKQTLVDNPEIKEVHFGANGHHYLNIHKSETVDKGAYYGRIIKIKGTKKGDNGQLIDSYSETPDLTTKIVQTLSREEILGTSDK